MIHIRIYDHAGDFAENKDAAKDIRINTIEKEISKKRKIIIDFDKVTSATQSFVHALISEAIRQSGTDALDLIHFKNCNDRVKTIIRIVVEYVQDGIFTEPKENS